MAKPNDLTGKKFGLLTVTGRAPNDKRHVVWYCDCECGTKDFAVRGSDLNQKRVKSCGCKKEEDVKPEKKVKKMSDKDNKDWDELYQYVKVNIMGYDPKQALSQKMALRLKGLLTNKFMENNNTKSTADYSYQTILNTFKFCSPTIHNVFRTSRFNDEMHRFNVALKIVEQNINDIYIRMKNVEKAKEEAKNTTVEIVNHVGVESKPNEKKKDRFSNLW